MSIVASPRTTNPLLSEFVKPTYGNSFYLSISSWMFGLVSLGCLQRAATLYKRTIINPFTVDVELVDVIAPQADVAHVDGFDLVLRKVGDGAGGSRAAERVADVHADGNQLPVYVEN
ncbi:hypothetical protein HDU76_007289 [Blyttiomyces sp. JEL0837]|nr:hypothetical protein HDU76_007289 [Blyttiomyces sp. JEL0837]